MFVSVIIDFYRLFHKLHFFGGLNCTDIAFVCVFNDYSICCSIFFEHNVEFLYYI